MSDYLECYAQRLALPVRTGVKVGCLTRQGDRLVVTAGDLRLEADKVVVALASHAMFTALQETRSESLRHRLAALLKIQALLLGNATDQLEKYLQHGASDT